MTDTYFSTNTFLLDTDTTTPIDVMGNPIIVSGTVSRSASITKWGGGSLHLQGTDSSPHTIGEAPYSARTVFMGSAATGSTDTSVETGQGSCIEFWMYITALPLNGPAAILSIGGALPTDQGSYDRGGWTAYRSILLCTDGTIATLNEPQGGVYGSNVSGGGQAVNLGSWNFIQWDGWHLVINGIERLTSSSGGASIASARPVLSLGGFCGYYPGAEPHAYSIFSGYLEDVRLSNRTLTNAIPTSRFPIDTRKAKSFSSCSQGNRVPVFATSRMLFTPSWHSGQVNNVTMLQSGSQGAAQKSGNMQAPLDQFWADMVMGHNWSAEILEDYYWIFYANNYGGGSWSYVPRSVNPYDNSVNKDYLAAFTGEMWLWTDFSVVSNGTRQEVGAYTFIGPSDTIVKGLCFETSPTVHSRCVTGSVHEVVLAEQNPSLRIVHVTGVSQGAITEQKPTVAISVLPEQYSSMFEPNASAGGSMFGYENWYCRAKPTNDAVQGSAISYAIMRGYLRDASPSVSIVLVAPRNLHVVIQDRQASVQGAMCLDVYVSIYVTEQVPVVVAYSADKEHIRTSLVEKAPSLYGYSVFNWVEAVLSPYEGVAYIREQKPDIDAIAAKGGLASGVLAEKAAKSSGIIATGRSLPSLTIVEQVPSCSGIAEHSFGFYSASAVEPTSVVHGVAASGIIFDVNLYDLRPVIGGRASAKYSS